LLRAAVGFNRIPHGGANGGNPV